MTEMLVRERREHRKPMESFRDDGFTQGQAASWQSTGNFVYNINQWVDDFTLDRQQGQASRLIIWCEAQCMLPLLKRVADHYSVPVYSSGGLDSLTAKHAIAEQISDAGDTVEVPHIGDPQTRHRAPDNE